MTVPRSAERADPLAADDDEVWPRPTASLKAALFLTYFGVAVLRPGLPQNLAFVDPLLLVICGVAIWSMVYRGSPATAAAVRLAPWVWLILVGSFIGLAEVGIPQWAWSSMARTVFAVAAFVGLWHLLLITKMERWAVLGTAAGTALTAGALLLGTFEFRGEAFFQHPNYAGHYMVMAGVVLVALTRTRWAKALAIVAIGIALWQTASFGAIAMLLAMLGVLGWRSLTRSTAMLTAGLIGLAIVFLFLQGPGADGLPSIEGWTASEVINEERFERSQGGRIELWTATLESFPENPWGVGPDGIKQREIGKRFAGATLRIQEAHSDPIGYLVERGVIGLVGYVGLWVVMWRVTRTGGLAHLLIVGMLVQGMFRETMHYRHGWLLLALACVWDARRATSGSEGCDAVPAGAASG